MGTLALCLIVTRASTVLSVAVGIRCLVWYNANREVQIEMILIQINTQVHHRIPLPFWGAH
jgi:hypothetical protein